MARTAPRKPRPQPGSDEPPRPDDWTSLGEIEVNGQTRVKWANVVTGEEVLIGVGLHPHNVPNALAVIESPEPEPDSELDDFEDTETATDRVALLLQGYEEGQGRAEVKIYKIKATGESYCAGLKPAEFEAAGLDYIRNNWGAGRYRITLYATNPSTRKFARRGTQFVELEAGPADLAAAAPPAATPEAIAQAVAASLATVLAPLVQAPQAKDPLEEMARVARLMREINPPAPPPPPAPSAVSQIKELMAVLSVGKEIREMIDPPPPPEDALSAALPKMLEIVGSAVAGQQQPRPVPIPAAELPAVAVPQSMQQTDEPENPELAMFKMYVSILNARAKAKADVEESAEQVYEMAPDDLFAMLKLENWFAELCKLVPTIEPHREWYEKVRVRVLEMEKEDNEGAAQ